VRNPSQLLKDNQSSSQQRKASIMNLTMMDCIGSKIILNPTKKIKNKEATVNLLSKQSQKVLEVDPDKVRILHP